VAIDRTAGDRLHRWVMVRMAERGVPSVAELARTAGVGRDTLQAWWRGRPPTPHAGEKVARALGTTYGDLLSAREGREGTSRALSEEDARRLARAMAKEMEPRLRQLALEAARRALDEREGRG
jgi:transcriptional regulator with XRE-family HTH domain